MGESKLISELMETTEDNNQTLTCSLGRLMERYENGFRIDYLDIAAIVYFHIRALSPSSDGEWMAQCNDIMDKYRPDIELCKLIRMRRRIYYL